MMQHFLQGVTLYMLFALILFFKLIILGILSKYNIICQEGSISQTCLVCLKLNLLSLPFLLILKTRNHLLFVIGTIDILVVQLYYIQFFIK